MQLRLFDAVREPYFKARRYTEDIWSYLNRSTDPGFSQLRDVFESWFDEYDVPSHRRDIFCQRFRNSKSDQHLSAFFELYLYTLLKRSGFEIEVEPDFNGSYPDFLMRHESGQIFLVEAAGIYPQNRYRIEGHSANILLDYLNDRIISPDFFLSINMKKFSTKTPSLSKLCVAIQRWVDGLDYEVEAAKLLECEMQKNKSDVALHYHKIRQAWKSEGEWQFELYASPKMIGRGTQDDAISSIHYGLRTTKHSADIVSALKRKALKASKYGGLNIPLIVAINDLAETVRQRHIEDALFGEETLFVVKPGKFIRERMNNGVWYGRKGYQNSLMSGIWFFHHISSISLNNSDAVLWHHPYAKNPLPETIFPFSQQIPDNISHNYSFHTGISISDFIF